MEENSTMPIEFKDTKNNIKIVITEQTDVISVSCICNHKEYILQCITDPSFQQKNSPYIAIIQPGQKTIDNSFEEPLMWINEKIQTADFLPDTKKKILSTLITNFPLFNDYKKIDIENLLQDTKFYDTKRKEIYNILKENIDNFESLSDVTKEISSHIKKAKNINKKTEIENICKAIVQETNIGVKELIENCENYKELKNLIITISNELDNNNLKERTSHRLYIKRNKLVESIEKKLKINTNRAKRMVVTVKKYLDDRTNLVDKKPLENLLVESQKLFSEVDISIQNQYSIFLKKLNESGNYTNISYQKFISIFSSSQIDTDGSIILNIKELEQSYSTKNNEASMIGNKISLLISDFVTYSNQFIDPSSDLIRTGILYMKQSEIRGKKNKRGLSEKEKKVERVREEIKKLYIDYRITQNQLINSVDDSLIFDDLNNNLIWNPDLENKLFELQKSHELVLKPKYNTVVLEQQDTNLIEEQMEDNQKQVSFLISYEKLFKELGFRYKIEMNKRKRELEDEDKQYHTKVLHTINNLPNIIKDKGMRKFDSKYYNFYEWLIQNNKELDNQTPLEFIKESKNSEDKDIILQLIQNLPSMIQY